LRRLAALAAAASLLAVPAALAGNHGTTLEQQARWEALHGGILGTGMFQATPWMQTLSRLLVAKAFRRDGREATAWASCVVTHESGWNPGALNGSSGAAGLAQFEVQWHPEYSDDGKGTGSWRIRHDPVFAVAAMHRLSLGGKDRRPWAGGGYSCP
jgi:hypothetical protein